MRKFVVLVARQGKQPMGYPACGGSAALSCMEKLSARGHEIVARTTANGIQEDLSLEQMRAIFRDEQ